MRCKTGCLCFSLILAIGLALIAARDSLADTIVLKDGRSIHCDAAREDGKVVRYWIGDSMLTVSRDSVERIERGGEGSEPLVSSSKTPSTAASRLAELPGPKFLTYGQPAASAAPLSVEALDKLEANVRAEPGDVEQRARLINALNAAAYLEYEAGKYAEAKALLERTLVWDSKNVVALVNLAGIELSEGRYGETVARASRAIDIEPGSQIAYYQLGAAYYALEKVPEAVRAWRAALKIKDHPGIRAALERAERELAVAGEFTNNRSRFFNVIMEGGALNPTLESAILGLLEESYGQLKRRFDYEPSEKISAIFYTQDTFFNITNAPTWAGALNDGKLRVPVGGLSAANDELAKTIMHELTHSFVYFKARGKCPTWLNEGLAQIMEGKSAAGYRSRIAELDAKGTLPKLQALGGSFAKLSTAEAAVAYAYALAAAEMLTERGLRSAIEVLEDLGQNYNISVALSRHTRYQDLDAFERELRQRLNQ